MERCARIVTISLIRLEMLSIEPPFHLCNPKFRYAKTWYQLLRRLHPIRLNCLVVDVIELDYVESRLPKHFDLMIVRPD